MLVRDILATRYDTPPLAYVHSFGCQQSVADGEKLMGLLAEMGYGFTSSDDNADFVLYNTCAVRESAEDHVFGNLGELTHNKKRKPSMIIAISGCMTEQQHIVKRLHASYPQVDIVLGTNAFSQLPKRVYEKLVHNKRFFKNANDTQNLPIEEGLPTHREGKLKAWIPIMYGCDNFCTYCIVPYVRGRERSRESSAILSEITALVSEGYREITLLGQNVNSYGKGLSENINFAQLLRRVNDISGDFIIRFMTSHPKDCTRELIDAIADCSKVAKHLHLPVQSGSDHILSEMNRHYTVSQYMALIDYARERMPKLTITSDIIVGFPGETYDDFTSTLDLVRRVNYTALYTFIYSRRSGTRAESLADPISPKEKSLWMRELLEAQKAISDDILHSYIGEEMTVLT
ncbi:MAG: tRNA (N6-isopentenyl adenosine(37)-C2)-methylthiotransferase MiaB, partial [Angelakisella sp.]